MAAMLAELLDVPSITSMNSVTITESEVSGERSVDGGSMTASAALPAVVSITERLPDARFPNFKGIMAAKKKPVERMTVSEAGLDAAQVGLSASWSEVESFAARPPRSQGTIVTDSGDGGVRIADFLTEQKFI